MHALMHVHACMHNYMKRTGPSGINDFVSINIVALTLNMGTMVVSGFEIYLLSRYQNLYLNGFKIE